TPQQRSLAQARLVAGLKMMLREDFETAVVAFDEALAANPRLNSAYGWRAEAYLALGDMKAAVTDFDTAIAREVSIPVNRGGRGEAALRAGRFAEAVEDLDAAIAAWRAGEIVPPKKEPDEAPDPRRRMLDELESLRAEAVAGLGSVDRAG
ncbi:MAG: tetratricopeptide repeat protein, partial [Planctomycetota bacterium]